MKFDEAIKILDPETRREALYKYDPEERAAVENEARHIAVQTMRLMYNKGYRYYSLEEIQANEGTFTPVPMPEPSKGD